MSAGIFRKAKLGEIMARLTNGRGDFKKGPSLFLPGVQRYRQGYLWAHPARIGKTKSIKKTIAREKTKNVILKCPPRSDKIKLIPAGGI